MVKARTVLGGIQSFVLAALMLGGFAQRSVAAYGCGGDCNDNGAVEINELILGVNIAFGTDDLSACPSMDADSSQEVEIQDLVGAVDRALEGCPVITCAPQPGGRCVEIQPGPDAQDMILTALLEAQPKDTIFIRAGTYEIDGQLSLQVDDVTIQGEGKDRTILSFANQTSGAEGLLVQANRFTIEGIGLEDSPGDLIKVLGADGVTFRSVRTEWTNGPATSNGSYGLYPVQCRDVLIEDSVVIGAADAGIYVGQSRNIVVRRNRVEFNVAGIEIENSTDADVYNNTATNNAGGVLVFNLPGPQVQGGRNTRVHDNQIYENNTANFGAPGSSVSGVPTGTGVMVLANDAVEVFDNSLRDNDSAHVILVSYNTAVIFGQEPAHNPDFDPYSEGVFIHDNEFVGGGMHPPAALDPVVSINEQFVEGGLPLPNILFDGDLDPAKLVDGQLPTDLRTCVQQPGATFVNIDIAHGLANVSNDLETVNCSHDPLPPITIGEGRHIAITPGETAQDDLLTALIEAQPGDDILVKAGTYELTQQLSSTVDHVTLRGEGMDQTILRFDGLTGGGEALLARGNDFTLRDLALEDGAAGADLFKAEGVDGLRIQNVRTEWTNGPDTNNGGYGIYPVQCKDVLIEHSVAIGASDTGIYVGQSRNVIIRRNRAEFNVAGIEIENSTGVDVYENTTTNNAGGILVFNLPSLQVFGQRTRVFNNQSFENNTPNFAPEGNIVGGVPTGTGMFVLANDMVEVFGNTFRDNNTSHVSLISYNTARLLTGIPEPDDPRFDPFSESLWVHDNTYEGGGTMPPSSLDALLGLLGAGCGLPGGLPVPNVVVDGDVDPAKLVDGTLPEALRTCVQEPGATFANLDVAHTFANVSCDPTPFNCSLEPLPPIAIAGVQ
jgi:parallel beta-helix repeat protein